MPHNLENEINEAWAAYQTTIPDLSELSAYQLERSKELFTAGYLAALRSAK